MDTPTHYEEGQILSSGLWFRSFETVWTPITQMNLVFVDKLLPSLQKLVELQSRRGPCSDPPPCSRRYRRVAGLRCQLPSRAVGPPVLRHRAAPHHRGGRWVPETSSEVILDVSSRVTTGFCSQVTTTSAGRWSSSAPAGCRLSTSWTTTSCWCEDTQESVGRGDQIDP